MMKPINVCVNRPSEPRIYLEVCKVAVSIDHSWCREKVKPRSKVLKCEIARELIRELKGVL